MLGMNLSKLFPTGIIPEKIIIYFWFQTSVQVLEWIEANKRKSDNVTYLKKDSYIFSVTCLGPVPYIL